MNLTEGAAVAAILAVLIQSGTLIFYAGEMRATLKEHDRRIVDLEKSSGRAQRDISFLQGKEGVSA